MRGTAAVTATLDWFGCATFRLRIEGLVVFLDAAVKAAFARRLPACELLELDYEGG